MHQNGLALTVTLSHLFRQWEVLSVFIIHRCWSGPKTALHQHLWPLWCLSDTALPHPKTLVVVSLSTVAAAFWLPYPCPGQPRYSALTGALELPWSLLLPGRLSFPSVWARARFRCVVVGPLLHHQGSDFAVSRLTYLCLPSFPSPLPPPHVLPLS